MDRTRLLEYFFTHQIEIKMFHFQTQKFGAHKASDEYLSTFQDNLDKFFEVYQGIHGKFSKEKLKLSINTELPIIKSIETHIALLENMDKYIKNTDLLNIRDEMLAEAHKLKYLLTFE